MITVLDAGALAGYSGEDHLVDDSQVKNLIGREFSCIGAALRASDARCTLRGRRHPYTWVEIRMADGSVRRHKSI